MDSSQSNSRAIDTAERISHPWAYRASRKQIAGVAILFGVGLWILNAGFDLLWAKYDGPMTVPMATVDALLSLMAGVMLLKLLISQRVRHRQIVRRLQVIAEMNHHIRNALTDVQLTAYVSHNQQFITVVDTAAERIQWALREVLPEANREGGDEAGRLD